MIGYYSVKSAEGGDEAEYQAALAKMKPHHRLASVVIRAGLAAARKALDENTGALSNGQVIDAIADAGVSITRSLMMSKLATDILRGEISAEAAIFGYQAFQKDVADAWQRSYPGSLAMFTETAIDTQAERDAPVKAVGK